MHLSSNLLKLGMIRLYNFSNKLLEFWLIKDSCIKLIPFFHIPKICSAETFNIRKFRLRVKADLLYNPISPFFFCLSDNQVSSELPVKK